MLSLVPYQEDKPGGEWVIRNSGRCKDVCSTINHCRCGPGADSGCMYISLPEAIWAKNGPPENNAGQPVDEILSHIGILNNKVDAFPEPGTIGLCGGSKVGVKKFSGAARFVPVLYGVAYCD